MRWAIALFLLGCGGGSFGDPDLVDASPPALADGEPVADASPMPADAATVDCPNGLPASFGDLGSVEANKNDIGGHYNVFIDLDDNPRWFFAMNLHPGRGVFAEGMAPGR